MVARGELLAWLAELLGGQTITKVEEGGKGYVYCQVRAMTKDSQLTLNHHTTQVLDSIFGQCGSFMRAE